MSDIVHREVEVPCSVEEAWKQVTDASWLGDDGVFKAIPGEEGWVVEGDQTRVVLVEEVDEGRRLVYRWASFSDEPTRVEVELAPCTGGTRISISEGPIEIRAMAMAASFAR